MKINYTEDCIIGEEYDGTPIYLKDYQKELKKMLKDMQEVLDQSDIPYFVEGGTLLGAVRHKDMIPWDDDIDFCFPLKDYKRLVNLLCEKLDSSVYVVQCLETDENYDITQPLIKVRKRNTSVDYDAFYFKNNCEENGIFIDFIGFSSVPESEYTNKVYRFGALVRTVFLLVFNYLNINVLWLKKRHIAKAYAFDKKGQGSSYLGYALCFVAWQNIRWNEKDIFPLERIPFGEFTVPTPIGRDKYLKQLYGDYMQIPNLKEVELLHSTNLKLKTGKMNKNE